MSSLIVFRRIRVLVFVIFSFLGFYCIKGDGIEVPDVTYLSVNNRSFCISQGDSRNSAITWIYPSNYSVSTESYFYPKINNSYNTRFEKPLKAGWNMKNWNLMNDVSLGLVLDTRWEALETLLSNNEFKHSNSATVHIKTFPLGFSVLASTSVEILLCEGWNPEQFSSYYIVIGGNASRQVLFKKVDKFNSNAPLTDLEVAFESGFSILSNDTWKTFYLDFHSGLLELYQVKDDLFTKIFNKSDDNPLKPMFLLTRSPFGSGKWKYMTGSYLQTNISSEFPLGPKLSTRSKEICVSLYVTLCDVCSMDFYIYNGTNKVFLTTTVKSTNVDGKMLWKEVRLNYKNNTNSSVQIYVATRSIDLKGDWGIDEVRACTTDEIKVSTITSNSNLKDAGVTCESLKHSKWRPKRNDIPSLDVEKDFRALKVVGTSFTVGRTGDASLLNIYSYAYRAMSAKQCTRSYKDPVRDKSNGYVTSSNLEVTVGDLLPYTFYEVKVTSPFSKEWSKELMVLTSETDRPTDRELPANVTIIPETNSLSISWNPLNCTYRMGGLVHQIFVTEVKTNASNHFIGTVNKYTVPNLKSFTNYTVEISTARDEKYFYENRSLVAVSTYNATTSPEVAPKVENLEVYATDLGTIDLRYDLPDDTHGIPVDVNTFYCLPDYKCETNTSMIATCELWPNKYCVHLRFLRSEKLYRIAVKIRNNGTSNFGDTVTVTAETKMKAPGQPPNLKSKVVNCSTEENYCYLNVSWDHPYQQRSSIDKFEVLVGQAIDDNKSDTFTQRDMHRVDRYSPTYFHVANELVYSRRYNVLVRSSNRRYHSDYTSITVAVDHLGQHIDQMPTVVSKSSKGITYDMPKMDKRLDSYTVIVFVQSDSVIRVNGKFRDITEDQLCQKYGDTWIAAVKHVTDDKHHNITIGDSSETYSSTVNATVNNKPLSKEHEYCITFMIRNEHLDTFHTMFYYDNEVHVANEEKSTVSILLIVMLVFLMSVIICVPAFIIYKYLRRYRLRRRNSGGSDHMDLSLESLSNAVPNNTYDRLISD